jgi:predicted DNA-binding transcriptional regulator YafY
MLSTLPDLPTLFDASAKRAPVTFRYRNELRTVDPFAIVHREGFWYVIGHDHLRTAQRAFRVDRMEGAVSVGAPNSYEVPDGFDARSAIAADPKLLGESEPVVAHVRVDAVRAPKVCREVGDAAIEERARDGSVVVAVPATNRAAFRSWLLGLLDHAEVLGPDEVRADVVSWLAAMAEAET